MTNKQKSKTSKWKSAIPRFMDLFYSEYRKKYFIKNQLTNDF